MLDWVVKTPLKFQNIEVVVRDCSIKMEFLEIHKIHRKTSVPESFFNKLAELWPATLLKKRL